MRVLLHTCCAPCLIYPLDVLRSEGNEVTGYYFNPNIHPASEYEKRLKLVEEYCKELELQLVTEVYDPLVYLVRIAGHEGKPERCEHCFWLRLERTASSAKDWGFQAFSTTLLVSPHQKHELIRKVGEEISDRLEISFLYQDWRPGYREAANKSRELGMYRQKYCGCVFSERERAETKGQD